MRRVVKIRRKQCLSIVIKDYGWRNESGTQFNVYRKRRTASKRLATAYGLRLREFKRLMVQTSNDNYCRLNV